MSPIPTRSARNATAPRTPGEPPRGRPFPAVSLVAVALQGLKRVGMLALAEPDEDKLATVALTETGQARYKALDQRQRARPDPPGDTGP